MRRTEWRPRDDDWQFGRFGGAAIGELIVRRTLGSWLRIIAGGNP
jgi:hypothetical protein